MAAELLDKLAKILNQAERAATPEEAEAFMAKAQALATTYSIDLAAARQHTAKKERRERPTYEYINIGERRKHNNARLVTLFCTVADANDVKLDIALNSTFVVAYGMPSDIEVVKALYASLSCQMVASANAWLKKGEYKRERVWSDRTFSYKPMDGRTARANFYDAYIWCIGNRLRKARKEALEKLEKKDYTVCDETGQEIKASAALVLRTKTNEISDYYKTHSRARGTWKGARTSAVSTISREAGDKAARTARIGREKAIGGQRKALAR